MFPWRRIISGERLYLNIGNIVVLSLKFLYIIELNPCWDLHLVVRSVYSLNIERVRVDEIHEDTIIRSELVKLDGFEEKISIEQNSAFNRDYGVAIEKNNNLNLSSNWLFLDLRTLKSYADRGSYAVAGNVKTFIRYIDYQAFRTDDVYTD